MYNFAQTFYIHSDSVRGADFVTLPRLDIHVTTYPKPFSKAAAGLADPGVTIAICEIDERGIPQPDLIVRGSKHHMTRSAMLAVRYSTVWVPYTFPSPVILKTNRTYAVILSTDGDSDYRFGTHKRALTSAEKKAGLSNPGFYVDGDLFQLADGVPQRIVGQDLSMKVYVARHTRLQRTLQIVNDRHEFFTVNSHSAGFFNGDEIVYDANTTNGQLSNGTITFSYVSKALAGNGTSFTSDFSPGDIIIFTDAANTTDFESNGSVTVGFGQIVQVIDDENMLLANEPEFSANAGYYYAAPTGRIYTDTPSSNQVILYDSSASGDAFRWKQGSIIKGVDSGKTATVQSINNFEVSRFTPEINVFTPNQTRVNFTVNFANTSYNIQSSGIKATIDANTDVKEYRAIIASRSNEVANSTVRASLFQNDSSAASSYKYKSMKADVVIETDNEFCSPLLVEDNVDFFLYTNDITSAANNVQEADGISSDTARYLSKVVTLAEGLDAEDLRVYLTAYLPPNSEIKVYAKVINSYDPGLFEDKAWSELEVKKVASTQAVSPAAAEGGVNQGYVEYEYGFRSRPAGEADHTFIGLAGTTSGSNTITISNYSNGSVTAGDMLILTNADNPAAPMVSIVSSITEVATGASVVMVDSVSDPLLVGGGFTVTKVPAVLNETAFTNSKNNNIVRYYKDGVKYDTYKSYGIKIVLLAGNPALSPRVADYRAIAMSA